MRAEGEEMNRIFLIGDSIRMGYCEHVKGLMADCAEVIYPEVNCRSSQCILMNLFDWSKLCDTEKVKIVHFNCGHWDAARFDCDPQPLTSLGEYEKNLESIVRNLKKYYPNAKLAFATTTPMNPDYPENRNPHTTEDNMRYNDVAKRVMQKHGVAINDLFAVAESWGKEYYIDYCHFTEEGYKILGKHVSDFIKTLLK
jgi:hypothetical protein